MRSRDGKPRRLVAAVKVKVSQYRLYQQNKKVIDQVRTSVREHQAGFIASVAIVGLLFFLIYFSLLFGPLVELDGSVCPLGPMEVCALAFFIVGPFYFVFAMVFSLTAGAVTGYAMVITVYFLHYIPGVAKVRNAVKRKFAVLFSRSTKKNVT